MNNLIFNRYKFEQYCSISMAFCLLFVFSVFTGLASEKPKLEPNAILRYEFPELSPNLATMFNKEPVPNVLIADLPANYTPKKKFPIVIYLDGGNGGLVLTSKWLREVFGPDDYICVRLPLFKAAKITTDPAGGLAILSKDFDVISKNYKIMLGKLFAEVPNITSKGSAIGGFSNGAHTTAILLEGGDKFIMKHFDHFYFVEGGIHKLNGETLKHRPLRNAHFLLMMGDRGRENPFSRMGGEFIAAAQKEKIDHVSIPMRGYGHEFPMDYKKLLSVWLRNQPFPEIAPKPSGDPVK